TAAFQTSARAASTSQAMSANCLLIIWNEPIFSPNAEEPHRRDVRTARADRRDPAGVLLAQEGVELGRCHRDAPPAALRPHGDAHCGCRFSANARRPSSASGEASTADQARSVAAQPSASIA